MTVDIYQNLIDNWESIDQLNEYRQISRLRIHDNPITNVENSDLVRQEIIARVKYLTYYGGSKIGEREKEDSELYYAKICYKDFCEQRGGFDKGKVQSLEDEALSSFMMKTHPRFYELVEKFNFTIDSLNNQKDDSEINIKSKVVEVTLLSKAEKTLGK